jgi:hypothetical protein
MVDTLKVCFLFVRKTSAALEERFAGSLGSVGGPLRLRLEARKEFFIFISDHSGFCLKPPTFFSLQPKGSKSRSLINGGQDLANPAALVMHFY